MNDSARFAIVEQPDQALARYRILDTAPEPVFDDLARRAAAVFGAERAAISFFAGDSSSGVREWFKARIEFAQSTLSCEQSFFLPLRNRPGDLPRVFAITDTLANKETRDHALVTGPPYVASYAGAAIVSRDQRCIGVLSVFGSAAQDIGRQELQALANLAALVAARLEARAEARRERPQPVVGADSRAPADELQRAAHALEEEIATRHGVEEILRQEQAFFDGATEVLPGAFYLFDADGRLLRWNQSFLANSGVTAVDLAGMRALDFVADADRAMAADAIRRIFEHGDAVTIEAGMRHRNGDITPHRFEGRALDVAGRRYCLGLARDLSERRQAESELRAAKERLDLALAGSNLAMWDWDLVTNTVYFNPGWAEMIGAVPREAEFRGEEVLSWNHPEDSGRFRDMLVRTIKGEANELQCEYRIPDSHGEWIWISTLGKVTEREESGRARRMTGTSANITKRKQAEEKVEFLATRDPLTGLPNRMLMNDRLEQGIANAARKGAQLAFMFIDLDRFKTINDSLGHDVGDELLKRVAARLSACVRTSDTVARLGGDEFAVILENLPNDGHEGAQNVAEKMVASMASPVMINGHHLNTSCSIGIGVFPIDGRDAQTLMKHADVAMYDAKAKGRNNYQFFSHEMNARAQERLAIENFLRLAVRRDELVLHYQPRVAFATGAITGVEALVRWNHPRRGLLMPDKFIGVAEDSGMIVPIGEWVMEKAFMQVAEWQRKSGRDLKIAVNLSRAQIFDGERLLRALDAAIKGSGLDPRGVEMELTETMLLKSGDDTGALLARLGAMGIGLAIDDFGTGYSSLSYLKQLPVDSIKVDSSFVRDIGVDSNDEAIVRAIIAMTHSLKLNVIAEGVEREEQYRVLRDLECDEYQGFFFSQPLPAAEFEAKFLDT
ncbi:MAG: EAL domain-containing protein [Betaproteobacteria bacterium]|nr:EAL domain-containing protein [Betaproteobacteria bacterium]